MYMPQLRRDLRSRGIQLKEIADRPFREGLQTAPAAAEEVRRRVVAPHDEVGAEKPFAPGMEWVPVGVAIFEARDPNLVALDVGDLEENGLTAPESMPVHEIEEEEIASVPLRNLHEQLLELFSGE